MNHLTYEKWIFSESAGEWISELKTFMKEHGEIAELLLTNYHGDLQDAQRAMEEYQGRWPSERAYSDDLVDNCLMCDLPDDHVAVRYFDYEYFCRDLFISDCFSLEDSKGYFHIFNNF